MFIIVTMRNGQAIDAKVKQRCVPCNAARADYYFFWYSNADTAEP